MPDLPINSLTPKQFAKLVGVSTSTIRRWEKDGVISSKRLPSGHRRFSIKDVNPAINYKQEMLIRKSEMRKAKFEKLKLYVNSQSQSRSAVSNLHTSKSAPKVKENFDSAHSYKYHPVVFAFSGLVFGIAFILVLNLAIIPYLNISYNSNPFSNLTLYLSMLPNKTETTFQKLSGSFYYSPITDDIDILADSDTENYSDYSDKEFIQAVLGESVTNKQGYFAINVNAILNGEASFNHDAIFNADTIYNADVKIVSQNTYPDISDIDTYASLSINPLSEDRLYTFPDADGEVSLLGQLIENNELEYNFITISGDTTSQNLELGTILNIGGGSGINADFVDGVLSLSSSFGTSIDSNEITDGAINESDLNSTNDPTDNYVLSYDNESGGFTWVADAGSSPFWSDGGSFSYLSSTSDDLVIGSSSSDGAAFWFDVSTGDMILEGATDNDYETTLDLVDPTTDRTITVPNASGVMSLLGQSISSGEIVNDTIAEVDLLVSNFPVNGQILSYNSGSGGFTWTNAGSGSQWSQGSFGLYYDGSAVTVGSDTSFAYISGGVGDLRVAGEAEFINGVYVGNGDYLQIENDGDLTFSDNDDGAIISGPTGGSLVINSVGDSLNLQANNDSTNYFSLVSDGTDLSITTTDNSNLSIDSAGDLTLADNVVFSLRSNFSHGNNQGLNLPIFAGSPSTVTGTQEGDIVYDSSNDALYIYDGGSFSQIGGGGYAGWTLDGDSGSSQLISSGNTATFIGGFGINTITGNTDQLTIALDSTYDNYNYWSFAVDGTTQTTLTSNDLINFVGGTGISLSGSDDQLTIIADLGTSIDSSEIVNESILSEDILDGSIAESDLDISNAQSLGLILASDGSGSFTWVANDGGTGAYDGWVLSGDSGSPQLIASDGTVDFTGGFGINTSVSSGLLTIALDSTFDNYQYLSFAVDGVTESALSSQDVINFVSGNDILLTGSDDQLAIAIEGTLDFVSTINSPGALTLSAGSNNLYFEANSTSYTFPTADGSTDYVLATDGNGVMSWQPVDGVGGGDNYQYWTFAVDGTNYDNITSQDVLAYNSGFGINLSRSADDELSIALDSTYDNYNYWSFAVDGTTQSTLTSNDLINFVGGTGISLSGSDDQLTIIADLGTSIDSSEIVNESILSEDILDGSIAESDLDISNAQSLGLILASDGSGSFTWVANDGGTGAYDGWVLSGDSGSPQLIASDGTVDFTGGFGINTSVSSGQLTIALDSTFDNYQYLSFAVDGVTESALSSQDVINFVSGNDISLTGSDDQLAIAIEGTLDFVSTINSPGALTLSAGSNNLYFEANSTSYTFPTADGSTDYVLATDGNGVMSWQPVDGVGGGDNYQYWTFAVDGGTESNLTSQDVLNYVGGFGIALTGSDDQLTIALDSTYDNYNYWSFAVDGTTQSTLTSNDLINFVGGTGISLSGSDDQLTIIADLGTSIDSSEIVNESILSEDILDGSIAESDLDISNAQSLGLILASDGSGSFTWVANDGGTGAYDGWVLSGDSGSPQLIASDGTVDFTGGFGINTSVSSGLLTIALDSTFDNYQYLSFAVDGVTESALTSQDVINFVSGNDISLTGSDDQLAIAIEGTLDFVSTINSPGALTLSAGSNNLYFEANSTSYTFPTADGSTDYVLATDGNGVMSWQPVDGVGGGDNYQYWTFAVDGGTESNLTSQDVLNYVGGFGIALTGSDDQLTIALDSTYDNYNYWSFAVDGTTQSTLTSNDLINFVGGTGISLSGSDDQLTIIADLGTSIDSSEIVNESILSEDILDGSIAESDLDISNAQSLGLILASDGSGSFTWVANDGGTGAYDGWVLSGDSGSPQLIASDGTVDFTGGFGINTSVSSGLLTIALDSTFDNYQYLSFAVDGVTESALSSQDVINFVSGNDISLTGSDDQLAIAIEGTLDFVSTINSPGALTLSAGSNNLYFEANSTSYTFPTADGSTDYVLATDGNGVMSWQPVDGVGGGDNYQYWTFAVDGTNYDNITSQDVLAYNSGFGINLSRSADDELSIALDSTYDNYNYWSFAVDGTTQTTLTSNDLINFVGGTGISLSGSDDQLTIIADLGTSIDSSEIVNESILSEDILDGSIAESDLDISNAQSLGLILASDGSGSFTWVANDGGTGAYDGWVLSGDSGSPQLIASDGTVDFTGGFGINTSVSSGLLTIALDSTFDNYQYLSFAVDGVTESALSSQDVINFVSGNDILLTGSDDQLAIAIEGTLDFVSTINSPGALTLSAGSNNLYFEANSTSYTFPTADGSTDYVLATDGNGVMSWQPVDGVGGGDNYQYWTFAVDGTNYDNITSQDVLAYNSGFGINLSRSADDELSIALDSTFDNYNYWSFAVDGTTQSTLTSNDLINFVGGTGISLSGSDDQLTIIADLGTSIDSSEIVNESILSEDILDGSIAESDLDISNAQSLGLILASDGSGSFTWVANDGGTGAYDGWVLSGDSGSPQLIASDGTVDFTGGFGINTSVSSGQLTIALDSTFDNYQYLSFAVDGVTESALSSQDVINFVSGNDISLTGSDDQLAIAIEGTLDFVSTINGLTSIDTTSLTITTDGTGDSEIVLADNSIGVWEINDLGGAEPTDNQCLTYDNVSGAFAWDDCATADTNTGIHFINEQDVSKVANAGVLNFDGSDFIVTADGTEGTIAIDYTNSQIVRSDEAETITGGWTFNTADTTFTSGVTFDGTADFNGAVTVDGEATFSNLTTFDGTSDFNGAVTADGAFTFNNTADFDGVVTFSAGVTNDAGEVLFSGGNLQLNDDINLTLGDGDDFSLNFDGTDTLFTASAGDLNLTAADDFIFNDAQLSSAVQLTDVDSSLANSNTGIVDAINDAWNASQGLGGLGLWSDGTDYVYLTADEVLGNPTSSGSNKLKGLFLADGTGITLGTDNDWNLAYDAAVDQRLELATSGTSDFLFSTAATTSTGFTAELDSITTANGGAIYSFDSLTSGVGFLVESDPGTATTLSGDLFKINVGSNVTNSGNLLAIYDNGSDVFKVSTTQIESAVPHTFSAAGDTSFAYDAIFTNQTASKIESYGPFTIEVGESFENNNLTLKAYGAGQVHIDESDLSLDSSQSFILDADDGGDSYFAHIQTGGTDDHISVVVDGSEELRFMAGGNDSLQTNEGIDVGADFDIAETYPTFDNSLRPGDLVKIVSDHDSGIGSLVAKADSDNRNILGIVSTSPAYTMGAGGFSDDFCRDVKAQGVESFVNNYRNDLAGMVSEVNESGDSVIPRLLKPRFDEVMVTKKAEAESCYAPSEVLVALAGRVPVKISNENGPILPGDQLTLSASQSGTAVKMIYEGISVGVALEGSNSTQNGKVMAFVNRTWFKPIETDNGELANQTFTLEQTEYIKQLVTDSSRGYLSDTEKQEVADIAAQLIADTLLSQTLEQASATAAADLADVISNGDIPTVINDTTAFLGEVFMADDLSVYGDTNLADTYVNGTLTIMGGAQQTGEFSALQLSQSGINSIGGDLMLQSSGLHGIDLLAGKVTIDEDGNVNIEGDLTVKGNTQLADTKVTNLEADGAILGETTIQGTLRFGNEGRDAPTCAPEEGRADTWGCPSNDGSGDQIGIDGSIDLLLSDGSDDTLLVDGSGSILTNVVVADAGITTSVSAEGITAPEATISRTRTQDIEATGSARLGATEFTNQIIVSNNTAGTVTIPIGQNSIRILFSDAYNQSPIVTASAKGHFTPSAVNNITSTGFTIEIEDPATQDLEFNWIGLGVN